MSQQAEKVLADALQLPEAERWHVASMLFDSMEDDEADEDLELGPEWDAEIKRRVEQIDRGEVRLIPMEEAWKLIENDEPIPD